MIFVCDKVFILWFKKSHKTDVIILFFVFSIVLEYEIDLLKVCFLSFSLCNWEKVKCT